MAARPKLRQCACCGQMLRTHDFAHIKSEPDGRSTICRECKTGLPLRPRGIQVAQKHRTGNPEGSTHTPANLSRAEQRAADFEAQLVSEGWDPIVARQRARAAYGLEKRGGFGFPPIPTIPNSLRRAMRDHYATARPGASDSMGIEIES